MTATEQFKTHRLSRKCHSDGTGHTATSDIALPRRDDNFIAAKASAAYLLQSANETCPDIHLTHELDVLAGAVNVVRRLRP